MGGLCEKHHTDQSGRAQRRDAAIHTLHTGAVDDRLPDDQALREELIKLREWWYRACRAVQTRHDTKFMPLDEAEYAIEWCIALAQEIINAELALRTGKTVSDSLATTRYWVWDRFKNLEGGLRSNGLSRDASK